MTEQQVRALTDAELVGLFNSDADLSLLTNEEQQRMLKLTATEEPSPQPDLSRGSDVAKWMMGQDSPTGNAMRSIADGGVATGIGGAFRKPIEGLARRMYQSALKATKAVTSRTPGGERALTETGLREGINVSRRGLEKTSGLVSELDDQVMQAIGGSGATVPRQAVMRRLADPVAQFRDQVAPMGDLRRIADVGREFRATTPAQIPVQRAQAMKQGTYRAQSKKYGQQGGAEVEAEKALARGLKEEIAQAVPEVAPLNARQSQLLHLRKALEDATRRTGNRDPIGLTDVIAAGTQPGMLAATQMMRAAPMSAGARLMNRTAQPVRFGGMETEPTDALAALVRALHIAMQEQE